MPTPSPSDHLEDSSSTNDREIVKRFSVLSSTSSNASACINDLDPFFSESTSFQALDVSSLSIPSNRCDDYDDDDLAALESLSQQQVLTRVYQTCVLRSTGRSHSPPEGDNEPCTTTAPWWRWLLPWKLFFNPSSSPKSNIIQTNDSTNIVPEDDNGDGYTSILGIPSICGWEKTTIPSEAHSLARLWLASNTVNRNHSHGKHVRICRPTLCHPRSSSNSPPNYDTVLIVCGWGDLVEFPVLYKGSREETEHDSPWEIEPSDALLIETMDKEALLNQAHGNLQSPLLPAISLVRACRIGPELVAISWGLDDGIIVIYKKCLIPLKKEARYSWRSVAIWTPSKNVMEATLQRIERSSMDDSYRSKRRRRTWPMNTRSHDPLQAVFQSGLMRVSDIVSISFSSSSYCILAASRISGCVEFMVLPMKLLSEATTGEAADATRHNPSNSHYAHGLPDLTDDFRCSVTPLVHTMDIHTDIITLAVNPRSTADGSFSFILACTGGESDESTEPILESMFESVSIWDVSVFDSKTTGDQMERSWTIESTLVGKILVKDTGPVVTTFVNVSVMNHLIHDRSSTKKRSRLFSETKIVSLSTSPPVCSLEFYPHEAFSTGRENLQPGLILSLMDYNGGLSLSNCSNFVFEPFQSTSCQEPPPTPFLLTRDSILSSVLSVIGLDSIVDYSFTFMSDDIALLIAFTRTCAMCAVRIRIGICQAVIVDAKEIFREKHPINRFFSGIVHAHVRPLIVMTTGEEKNYKVSLSMLERRNDMGLVKDFLQLGRYKDALALIEGSLRHSVSDTVRDDCYKFVWENNGDIFSLQNISDFNYLVHNVIHLGEIMSDETELSLTDVLTLYKVTLRRLDAEMNASDEQSTLDDPGARDLLRSRLRYLETLLGLPNHAERTISIYFFRQLICLESLIDVAKYFANAGDVQSLSIVMARNWVELGSNTSRMDILDNIPLSLEVSQYAHLLPCCCEQSTFSYKVNEHRITSSVGNPGITTDDVETGAHIQSFVEKLYNLKPSQDILEDNIRFNHFPDSDDVLCKVIYWYLQRAQAIYRYTGQLDSVIEFCDYGLSRCTTHHFNDEHDFVTRYHELLSLKAQYFRFRQFIIYENVNRIQDKLTISQMRQLGTDGVLRRFLTMHDNLSTVSDILKLAIQSSVYDSLPHTIHKLTVGETEITTVTSFALNALSDSISKADCYQSFLRALELCAIIAKSSSPSLPTSERLIKDDQNLNNFITAIFAVISSKALFPEVISHLWTLYESLSHRPLDSKYSTLAHNLWHSIVAVDLTLKWVDACSEVTLSMLQEAREKNLTAPQSLKVSSHFSAFGYHVAACMARGFFERLTSLHCNDLRIFLLQFLSDITDLSEQCFESSLSIPYIVEEYLFREALTCNSFSVIREIILMPETFINHGSLDNYLMDHIRQIISHMSSPESYEIVKSLQGILGKCISATVTDELKMCFRYYSYTRFLKEHTSVNFTTMTYEAFRTEAPIIVLRPLVKISMMKWVDMHPEWIEPDRATDLCTDLFSVLLTGGFDSFQVESRRYSLDQLFNKLLNVAGDLNRRDFILLRSIWVQSAMDQQYQTVAVAFTILLIFDIKNMSINHDISSSVENDLLPAIDTVTRTLAVLVSGESFVNKFTLFKIGITFLNSLVISWPMKVWKQVDYLSDILRQVEIKSAKLYEDEAFRTYQRDVSRSVSALSCGLFMSQMISASSKTMIDLCLTRTMVVKRDSSNLLSLQPRDVWLDVSLAVGFHDSSLPIEFIDEKTDLVNTSIKDLTLGIDRPLIVVDDAIVKQLCDRGYSAFGAKRAALSTGNKDFLSALRWAIEHSNDSKFNEPMVFLKRCQSPNIDIDSISALSQGLQYLKRMTMTKKQSEHHMFGRDQSEKESLGLSNIQMRLKNLAESERKRLADEGRKLLAVSRKAKHVFSSSQLKP